MAFMIIGCNVILFTWKIIKTNYSSYCSCASGVERGWNRGVSFNERGNGWNEDNKSANVFLLFSSWTSRICWRRIYELSGVISIIGIILGEWSASWMFDEFKVELQMLSVLIKHLIFYASTFQSQAQGSSLQSSPSNVHRSLLASFSAARNMTAYKSTAFSSSTPSSIRLLCLVPRRKHKTKHTINPFSPQQTKKYINYVSLISWSPDTH